jgi:hypothetical protein
VTLSIATRRRAPVSTACALVGLAVAVALVVGGPPGVDQPAHLFQTWFFEHVGFGLWNNLWYAGRYEFVNYSLLYYPLASIVPQPVIAIASCAIMAGGFAVAARREWGDAANVPSIAWAVMAPAVTMISGDYPFLAGAAAAVAAPVLLQRGNRTWALIAMVISLGFSPLAFVLGVAVIAGSIAGRPRPLAILLEHRFAVAGFVAVGVIAVVAQRVFVSGGAYPYHLTDFSVAVAYSLAGLYLAGGSAQARPLRTLFAAYLVLNVVAFAMTSPLGSNSTRLFGLGGVPLLWLAANIGVRRARWLVASLLALTLVIQVYPFAQDAYASWQDPAANSSYWTPVLRFLSTHRDLQHRVEVVATWGHWEAYYLARHDVPLARGWFRQDDFPTNSVLYHPNLTGPEYRAWLRSLGVRYVFLPDTALDYSAVSEAALLRSGRSGLQMVARLPHWAVYQLPHPTGIVAAPAGDRGRILRFGPTTVRLAVSGPGTYLLRVRYSPYWEPSGNVCATPAPDGMTWLHAPRAGAITLQIDPTVGEMAQALAGDTPTRAC